MKAATGARFLLLLSLSFGCDPSEFLVGQTESDLDEDTGDDSDDDASDYPEAEEGTCTAFKFAYCDAVAQCSAFETRQECELDLGWLICKEDAPLGSCQARIEKAMRDDDCEQLPQDCTPEEIADRSLVIELCEEIHVALCEHRLFCGLELSLDGCVETLARVEPCDSFTSFLPTAVDCAEAYGILGCGEPMPQVCAGSLRR